mmetsp:Transcript_7792/g.14044  ORF Transcript_7792/g.14044 Transcript_7792/m.14044 type:complete len:233 (-) Transcript_7792:56-754(-)|eukprot:CAMPEP_0198284872 /NCGR_PEP_ID=MMETSP1449-20131203/4262_1 /TAXON_ID=420275 /ORGANISM="Attheya septentrionalis, Strain CCMP2084" /LENGTH=232 /DNA_ID=CAMNT_0043982093 /DNA_START=90 /DNA_END=788 /DNA_ORIENTATION=+
MFFLVVAITVILSVLGSIQAFTTPASTSNVRNGRVFSKRGRMVHDFPSFGSRALYASSSSGKHNRGEKPFFGDGVAVLDDSAELVDCLVRSFFAKLDAENRVRAEGTAREMLKARLESERRMKAQKKKAREEYVARVLLQSRLESEAKARAATRAQYDFRMEAATVHDLAKASKLKMEALARSLLQRKIEYERKQSNARKKACMQAAAAAKAEATVRALLKARLAFESKENA